MAVSWLLLVMAGAVFVSMVLLAVVCLHCRNKGPLVYIRQANPSEESTEFRVIHPSQPTIDRNSIHPSSNQLSPFSLSADPGTQRRHRSFTPTETDSNPSYENPADGPDYVNSESDAEDPGYIIVLPEGETPLTNQSRASTPSSDVLHDYENVPEKKDAAPANPASVFNSPNLQSAEEEEEEDREYLNVDPLHFQRSSSELSAQSDSDSDDDEGNYVNVHDGTQTD
ncbi:uncharacterized protein LOC121621438 isoform X1 [Chelmon rostratus]|uniref:uncharacterized protein LOC121621438 isoform X1 n=1 Tax=Chelmon rostratus TaxID=109905 RepID=UPI001BE4EC3A|nr:uncharacterized protein LOC121621438 isoform X1 [Chelmon rostratus]XP_041813844.1 uncharacterized protein LOC121621438 isoform X1 [Chelmon rostratus]XP_041813845.1 uncharacterized protein LOC121621438 isoform X1 [Chelmon rostratus]